MGRGPAQVLESVVGVPAHATLGASLGVGHLRGHSELLGDELGGNLGAHRVHGDGQPVRLFAAEFQVWSLTQFNSLSVINLG